ncbi:hypothetical protein [Streptomyces sp. NPDC056061]|uniref:hypothetical protein n=1 Tax=Streptomyces sp. NPDC056061 TaxID=3345700 RepID=UPI0035D9B900
METTSSRTPGGGRTDRTVRTASWFALIMLVPVFFGSVLLVLSTKRASGCVTYGEGCADVPQGWIPGCLVAAIVSGVVAVAWPERWLPHAHVRAWLLGLHLAAQFMTVSLILAYA